MTILEYGFVTLLIAATPTLLVARWLNERELARKEQPRSTGTSSNAVLAISIAMGLVGGGALWLLIALHIAKYAGFTAVRTRTDGNYSVWGGVLRAWQPGVLR